MTSNEVAINEFLEHHGVKGQKWGITNKHPSVSLASRSKKVSPPPAQDHKDVQKLRTRPVSSLSNQELQLLNNRMNLEQNYSRLNPSKIASGKKAVAEIIGSVGLGVGVYNLVKSPAGKAAIAVGKKLITHVKIS